MADQPPLMSDMNGRNRQLRLAFDDGDLRTPKHDEIMAWLTDWVEQPRNIERLFRRRYASREALHEHVLDEASKTLLKSADFGTRMRINEDVGARFETISEPVNSPWPDEPTPSLALATLQWEWPLKDERGAPIGYCDLFCQYRVGWDLKQVTRTVYRLEIPDRKPSAVAGQWRSARWNLVPVEDRQFWAEDDMPVTLLFEVKSEIGSVGKLMCQIQRYKGTKTVRDLGPCRFVVVAPPHELAESICRKHRILYLKYQAA